MAGITKIGFIGAGNVASHLATSLHSAGLDIRMIANRSAESASTLAQATEADSTTRVGDLHNHDLDLIIISVPDSAIESVSLELGGTSVPVVHTSGAVSVNQLAHGDRKTGVFYPLQTLTKGSPVNMEDVPLCIHAQDDALKQALRSLALKITPLVYEVDDEQRRWLHVAAVLINNNINHLLAKVEDLIVSRSLDREILAPLLKETVHKAGLAHPNQFQTGPAIRGDESTKQVHLELLRKYGDDQLIELYMYFWRSIQHYNQSLINPGHTDC